MQSLPFSGKRSKREDTGPVKDASVPLDQAGEEAVPPTEPLVETALDDDEGGADPIDPDTGRSYDDKGHRAGVTREI